MTRIDTGRPTVGVNLTWLVPGVVGGSEEYTIRLLRAASDLMSGSAADDFELRLYGQPKLFSRYPDLAGRFAVVHMPGRFGAKGLRVAMENSWLAAVSGSDQVMHHAGGVVPLVRWQTPILTVHDLQPLDLPANFGPVKRRWLGAMLPYSVRAARLVLCPSRFTAFRLHERLGVPDDRIRVIPHGHTPELNSSHDPEVTTKAAHAPASLEPRVAALLDGDAPFVLLPAIAYGHKRHRDIIEALADIVDVALVATGTDGPETPALKVRVRELGMQDRVHFTGRVDAADLDLLYQRALALVFPSEYEGFGNPALEAMNHGCPALVSDSGSLPEVVGHAGLVIPTGSVPAWRRAIARVRDEPGLAQDLVGRGRERAASFTAEKAGQALIDAYRLALRLPLTSGET